MDRLSGWMVGGANAYLPESIRSSRTRWWMISLPYGLVLFSRVFVIVLILFHNQESLLSIASDVEKYFWATFAPSFEVCQTEEEKRGKIFCSMVGRVRNVPFQL